MPGYRLAREAGSILQETARGWTQANGSMLAAALSYYTIFSLAPLLLVAVSVAGLVFSEAAVTERLVDEVATVISPQAANALGSLLGYSMRARGSGLAAGIGVAGMLAGASLMPYDNYERYDIADDMGKWVADFNAGRYRNDTSGFPANREIWESVVAVPTFDGGRLTSLELHPITLGFRQPPAVRGRPLLADRELGAKIIGDLVERSRPHGTAIEWDGARGIGVVRLGPP